MTVRLRQIISAWFILQILMPFTAPLQTLDLVDLLGHHHRHHSTSSPESTTTPTISEASIAHAVSVAPNAKRLPAQIRMASLEVGRGPFTLVDVIPSSPQVQQSVLRL